MLLYGKPKLASQYYLYTSLHRNGASGDSYLKLACGFASNGKGRFGSGSSRWDGTWAATLGFRNIEIGIARGRNEALIFRSNHNSTRIFS